VRVAMRGNATRTRAFRAVAKVGSIPVDIGFVVLGVGRNELTLMVSGPRSARRSLTHIETHLARLLGRRARS
jgi:hypothetical protein